MNSEKESEKERGKKSGKEREKERLRKKIRVSERKKVSPFWSMRPSHHARMCSKTTVTNRLIFTCGSYCAYCEQRDSIILHLGKQLTRSKSRETKAHLIGNSQNAKQRHCLSNSNEYERLVPLVNTMLVVLWPLCLSFFTVSYCNMRSGCVRQNEANGTCARALPAIPLPFRNAKCCKLCDLTP